MLANEGEMNGHYTAWQILQAALRLDLIEAYIAREITLAELAQSAELSPRQCIRLVKRYRESGPTGLLSRRQGKPGNHQLKADNGSCLLGSCPPQDQRCARSYPVSADGGSPETDR